MQKTERTVALTEENGHDIVGPPRKKSVCCTSTEGTEVF